MINRFRGSLVGAIVGDCLGGMHESSGSVHTFAEVASKSDPLSLRSKLIRAGDRHVFRYSSDSLSIIAASESILAYDKVSYDKLRSDFQRRLVESLRHRSGSVHSLSSSMAISELSDSLSRSESFEASKYDLQGNCGLVRGIPCGLSDPLLAPILAGSTHSHVSATEGAKLLGELVHWLVHKFPGSQSDLFNKYPNGIISRLQKAALLAEEVFQKDTAEDSTEFQEIFSRRIGTGAGANVALASGWFGYQCALIGAGRHVDTPSVPAHLPAIKADQRSVNLYGNSNRLDSERAFERESPFFQKESHIGNAINWAVSLGGDTRSNACIAGALSGAHWGMMEIPDIWLTFCEGVPIAIQLADQLAQKADIESSRIIT